MCRLHPDNVTLRNEYNIYNKNIKQSNQNAKFT